MAKHDPKQFSEPAPGPRMGDVGLMLRTAREDRRLDLREVADRLRIRQTFLSAIEEGRYGDLPGATYAVGFVRAYAEAMGLDGDEIVRRFKEESAIVPKNADLDFPTPVNEGGLPSGAIILLALILAGAVYGVWYWSTTTDQPIAEMIQDVPDRFVALIKRENGEQTASVPEGAAPAGEDTAPTAAAPAPSTPAATAPAPTEAEAPAPATTTGTTSATTTAPAVAPPPADATDVEPPRAEADGAAEPAAAETTEPAATPAAPPRTQTATAQPAPQPADEAPRTAPVERGTAPARDTTAEAAPSTPVPVPAPAAPAEAPAVPAPAAPAPAAPATPPTAPPAPELAAAPTDVPTDGRVFGSENTDARIVLHARADSWVQVRSPEGLLLTRLLKRGDSYRVPAGRGDLELMVGNAGGLVIEVDGRTLPPMGRTGEVLRGIPLDVERLKAGVANAG